MSSKSGTPSPLVQRLGGSASEAAREAREGSVTSLGRGIRENSALREIREGSAKREIREGSAKREIREGSAKREVREGSVASSSELGEAEEERLGGQLIKTGSLSSLGTRYRVPTVEVAIVTENRRKVYKSLGYLLKGTGTRDLIWPKVVSLERSG